MVRRPSWLVGKTSKSRRLLLKDGYKGFYARNTITLTPKSVNDIHKKGGTSLLEWVGFPTYVEKAPECDERRSCVEEVREVGDAESLLLLLLLHGRFWNRGSEFGPNSVPWRVRAELGLATPALWREVLDARHRVLAELCVVGG
ncbi:ATP-dependent 6-phosphofructokinase 6-like [Iris pallida]|uniref:ATP-dependent 6-phosphofructokinase 6-like n=1 Tax=Iris pallida TaxID=29817 RepID=A0AAX6H6C5_IRIPA|nr:ATP-dependent 6-phosphofructokinase 6-like [Iris pallida]